MADCVIYVLDGEDRIIELGGQWDDFAQANDGEGLCGQAVIGTRFWDHISGDALRDLLGRVFQRARKLDEPITVPARCDSPGTVRHLSIRVFARNPNCLEITSCVTSEMPRSQWRPGDRSRAMLQMCSWCNRVRVENQWLEIENAFAHFDLANAEVLPKSSHGICPDCKHLLIEAAGGEPRMESSGTRRT